jgi:hypothetical protein
VQVLTERLRKTTAELSAGRAEQLPGFEPPTGDEVSFEPDAP